MLPHPLIHKKVLTPVLIAKILMAGFAPATDLAAGLRQEITGMWRRGQYPVELPSKIASMGHKTTVAAKFAICRFQVVANKAQSLQVR